MKKLILLLYLSLLGVGLNAQQQYKSVLNNGIARWSNLVIGTHVYGSFEIVIGNSDTLINNILYKKIHDVGQYMNYEGRSINFESDTEWQNYIPEYYPSPNNYYFIRESEDASKLYMYDTYKNEEILIFDLDLEVGDPFFGIGFMPVYVDSVYIKDGLKHVQFDCFVYHRKLTFIESVGPNVGIYYIVWAPMMVNCFQNELLFYKNDIFPEYHCGWQDPYDGLVKINYEDFNIQIESGNLIISCETLQNVQVVIDNIQGQRCFDKSFSGLQNLSIPIANFSKGVYILRVFDKNTNKQYTSKIIL